MHQPLFKLILPSNTNEVSKVEKLVCSFSEHHNLDKETQDTLAIISTELVNNAIIHGNKKNCSKKVLLELKLSKNKILIHVHDEGDGFIFEDVPKPTEQENLLKPSGRGIFIVKQMADGISYNQDNPGTSVNVVLKIK